jgi:hypothetical protein
VPWFVIPAAPPRLPNVAADASDGVAGVTVKVAAGLVTVPEVAVIEAEPTDTPVATPVAEIVATVVALEVHVTVLVMSLVVVEPEGVPVAMNCCVPPTGIEAFTGVTAIDVKSFGASPQPDVNATSSDAMNHARNPQWLADLLILSICPPPNPIPKNRRCNRLDRCRCAV